MGVMKNMVRPKSAISKYAPFIVSVQNVQRTNRFLGKKNDSLADQIQLIHLKPSSYCKDDSRWCIYGH